MPLQSLMNIYTYIYIFGDVLSIINMRSKLREDYKLIYNLDSHR